MTTEILQKLLLCGALVGASSFYAMSERKYPRRCQLFIGFVLASFGCSSQISDYFEPCQGIFALLNYSLAVLGGLVGAVTFILLPEITTGTTVGILWCLVFRLVLGSMILSWLLFITILFFLVALSIYCAHKYQIITNDIRTSLVTGLLISIAADIACNGNMINVVQSSIKSEYVVNESVHPRQLIIWGLVSTILFVFFSLTRSVPKSQKSVTSQDAPCQKTFSYPDSLEYNYFEPENIPDLLKSYSDIVFPLIQSISVELGFQIDNSRNQAEHLLMLLSNEASVADLQNRMAPPMRLHKKMLKNYVTWCQRMGVSPKFSVLSGTSQAPDNLIDDLLVYLLVWGEAANLKHMPECLCYLFHKCMTDHINNREAEKKSGIKRSLYYGYFLDMTVTPIYDVISKAMKSTEDHSGKKTYDDFNEFFWSPSCLNYPHHVVDSAARYAGLKEGEGDNKIPISSKAYQNSHNYQSVHGDVESVNTTTDEHVAWAMNRSTKTYIEKRSWLHSLLTFHRIIEFHIVTFTLISVYAFSVSLLWSFEYTLLIASVVFWQTNFLGIIWTILEIWRLYPTSSMLTGPASFGYVLRIVAGFVILVYQSIYYHWSFLSDNAPEDSFRSLGDANFWWWQYVWLSLLSLFVYGIEFILCFVPSWTSAVLTYPNDMWQALLNVCYPLTELYVGKTIHVPQKDVVTYIFFWITLLGFKFWFAFYYIIFPLTVPTVEMYDDYMNFENSSFIKTSIFLILLWSPHFMVYIIDLSIWYAVWASVVGGMEALIQRQGAVRNISSFQSHFMRLPVAYCKNLMPLSSNLGLQNKGIYNSTSSANLTTLPGKSEMIGSQSTSDYGSIECGELNPNINAAYETTPLLFNYKQSSIDKDSPVPLKSGEEIIGPRTGAVLSEFLDVRSKRWVIFSKAWNAVIDKLRDIDYLSNNERRIYVFTSCDWFLKDVYLPLCITAGSIERMLASVKLAANKYRSRIEPDKKMLAIETFKAELPIITIEAMSETWELMVITLNVLLGDWHKSELSEIFNRIKEWCFSDLIFDRMEMDGVISIADHISGLVGILNGVYEKRKRTPIVTEEWLKLHSKQDIKDSYPTKSMKKNISYGFLAGLEGNSTTESRLQSSTSVIFTPDMMDPKFTKLRPLSDSDGDMSDLVRNKVRDKLREVLGAIRNSFTAMLGKNEIRPGVLNNSAINDSRTIASAIAKILTADEGFLNNDIYASTQLDLFAKEPRMGEILGKLHGLLCLRQSEIEPASAEARRRINFFANSLFMEMPSPPSVTFSKDFTCMTPYYSEDVLLTPEDLLSKNSDGVSTILYLQTIYKREWGNFMERRGLKDDSLIWSSKHVRETRMWASLRAQTLFRTVDGMMHTEAAIRFMADLECIKPTLRNSLAILKFNYVVACQVYGTMKKNMDHKADDIDFLLSRHPNLRVAYIDSRRDKDVMTFYSVLIKYDPERSAEMGVTKVKEVYRVKLPGNPILGEGKPENQNHAIIFSRGRYLQAVDMNQDGYFEEALKMRNLLEEFDVLNCSILGFREHIFTGDVSSVANYMALQEKSFVTLGQRVLNWPLRVRQHYGHPDLFDKMFVMTEGGMSKASKGINLSEDVFAGFNATIRGHNVGFKEYVQVGKGRDVGLQQTYKFEAKLAQGNAEQSLSRDLNRICDRLDFFRLLSFYFGGIGHYLANTMVMITLYMVLYIMLILAIYDAEGVGSRPIMPEGVTQLLLAGMGILQTLPLMATLTVEKGVIGMLQEIAYMIISGGPLYFIFHIQTKCYYFQQTLMAGGAMYRPTGRGFVIRHSPFDENYRFFASSHVLIGFEVMVALILIAIYTKSKQYVGLTWSLWLIVISFLMGPFWFNPVSFEWGKVIQDYNSWMTWMGEQGGRPEQSWILWWREDNTFYKKMSFSWRFTVFLQRIVPWCIVGYGICGPTILTSSAERQKIYEILYLFAAFIVGHFLIVKWENIVVRMYAIRRTVNLIFCAIIFSTALFLIFSHQIYIKFFVAAYFFGAAFALSLLLLNIESAFIYKIHDYVVGHFLFLILILLSVFQLSLLQTWLLYQNAISSGVAIDDILKYARMTKEKPKEESNMQDSSAQIAALNKQLAVQDAQIKLLLTKLDGAGSNTELSSGSSDPIQSKYSNFQSSPGRIPFSNNAQLHNSGSNNSLNAVQNIVLQSVVSQSGINKTLDSKTSNSQSALEGYLKSSSSSFSGNDGRTKRPKTPNASRPVNDDVGLNFIDGNKNSGGDLSAIPSPVLDDFVFKQPDAMPPREVSSSSSRLVFVQPDKPPPRENSSVESVVRDGVTEFVPKLSESGDNTKAGSVRL